MDKIEKLIYSVKHLPSVLYFGSVGLIGYDIYCNLFKEKEFLNEYVQTLVYILFIYMTYLGTKKIKKKK
jgi:FtsH-binding integral membrane protein